MNLRLENLSRGIKIIQSDWKAQKKESNRISTINKHYYQKSETIKKTQQIYGENEEINYKEERQKNQKIQERNTQDKERSYGKHNLGILNVVMKYFMRLWVKSIVSQVSK